MAHKMITAFTIVDTQAFELRRRAGTYSQKSACGCIHHTKITIKLIFEKFYQRVDMQKFELLQRASRNSQKFSPIIIFLITFKEKSAP